MNKYITLLVEEVIKNIEFEKAYPSVKKILKSGYNSDFDILFDEFYKKNIRNLKHLEKYSMDDFLDVENIPQNVYNEIVESEIFKQFILEKFNESDIPIMMNKFDENGMITIFRSMTVSREWLKNLDKIKNLGIYWSWNSGYLAYPNEEMDYEIEIIGKIHQNNINMDQTIFQNLIYGGTEDEITLKKNTPINVIKILYRSNNTDMKYKELPVNRTIPS
jgi:hypothetical protein